MLFLWATLTFFAKFFGVLWKIFYLSRFLDGIAFLGWHFLPYFFLFGFLFVPDDWPSAWLLLVVHGHAVAFYQRLLMVSLGYSWKLEFFKLILPLLDWLELLLHLLDLFIKCLQLQLGSHAARALLERLISSEVLWLRRGFLRVYHKWFVCWLAAGSIILTVTRLGTVPQVGFLARLYCILLGFLIVEARRPYLLIGMEGCEIL